MSRRRPLVGRELWRIGDWGGASGQIGRRWEELGAAELGALVDRPSPSEPAFVPRAVVSFVHETARERAVQAAGLTHADALLIGPLDGQVALQPIDFKWSLEVARPGQVSAESLAALLAADLEEVRQAVEAQLDLADWGLAPADEGLPPLDALRLIDGLFLAPSHAANHSFLVSQANLRQEQPLRAEQIVLAEVDGQQFFASLPGWEVGEALAAQEGARRALATLEGAEHYYRLGAGILGALLASRRSIFDPTTPEIDPLQELGGLRRARRLSTTEQVVEYFDRVMAARAELTRTLNQLGRRAYPFGAFRKALLEAGVVLPDKADATPEDRRWSRLYGLVQRELSALIVAEGRLLRAAGQTDAEAVAALALRAPELALRAGEIAGRLIAAEQEAA